MQRAIERCWSAGEYELCFLGHLELLLEKGNDAFKSTALLPMLGRCIQCGVKTLQLPVLHHMVRMMAWNEP